MESLGDALLVAINIRKRTVGCKLKMNDTLAFKLEREKNDAGTSNINSLGLVEDENDGYDMIIVQNPNRIR